MKIVLWTSHYLPSIGGLEVMTHTLAKQLQQRGHTVLVISNQLHSEDCSEMTIEGVQVFFFPFKRALFYKKVLLIKTIILRIQEVLKHFEADLINVHGWYEDFCFYQTRIAEKNKLPLCITLHGLLDPIHYKGQSCLKLWSMAGAVNTVSQGLIEALIQYGLHHQALQLIYNGLPLPPLAATPLPTDSPRLLMIGRLSEEKGFDLGFYALKNLIQKYPDLKLTLVGGGDQFSQLAHLKTTLGLDQHVTMTNFVDPRQVYQYINQASIVIVPSHYEPFGLVALEAALYGRPVIASNVAGLNEVVLDHISGVLFEAKNPQALSDTLDQLLSQPEKIIHLGENAQIRARRLFTIENTTQKYLNMYQMIMEK